MDPRAKRGAAVLRATSGESVTARDALRRAAEEVARRRQTPEQRSEATRAEAEERLRLSEYARQLSPAQLRQAETTAPGFTAWARGLIDSAGRQPLDGEHADDFARLHQDLAAEDRTGIWRGENTIAKALRDPTFQRQAARFFEENPRWSWKGYSSPGAAVVDFLTKAATGEKLPAPLQGRQLFKQSKSTADQLSDLIPGLGSPQEVARILEGVRTAAGELRYLHKLKAQDLAQRRPDGPPSPSAKEAADRRSALERAGKEHGMQEQPIHIATAGQAYLAAAHAEIEGRELRAEFTPEARRQIEADMGRPAPTPTHRDALKRAAEDLGRQSTGDTSASSPDTSNGDHHAEE